MKTIFTLNINNYSSEITKLTYPYIQIYANKIGAKFHIITERKFLNFPIVYEKLQIYELGKKNDWNIYFDSDVLIHPDLFDITDHISKDTVLHWSFDMAGNRWTYDKYFLRDGRNIGSCDWFTIASDWCIDLWKPLEISFEEALKNIHPTTLDSSLGDIKGEHLIDDYTLSRNIAKYGLKFVTFLDLLKKLGRENDEYLWHPYIKTEEQKIEGIKEKIKKWKI